jgi:extradiol dioxygenase
MSLAAEQIDARSGVRSLAYLGLRSTRASDWLAFGPEILGMEVVGGPQSAVHLRVDDVSYRVSVEPAEQDELAYLGWEVADADDLERLSAGLKANDVVVHEADSAARPAQNYVWFEDPFGFRHELAVGLDRGKEFTPGRPIEGFVTGELGLGHVVLMVPDLDSAESFYPGNLGFRLSDTVSEPDGLQLKFLHCNPRHHTLALAYVPGMVGMHHLMVEVASLDDVGRALDLVNERGIPLAMGFGRHSNDFVTSFYVRSPSGCEIEYGYGGRLVDDSTWQVTSYRSGDLWGHRPPPDAPAPGILRPIEPVSAS